MPSMVTRQASDTSSRVPKYPVYRSTHSGVLRIDRALHENVMTIAVVDDPVVEHLLPLFLRGAEAAERGRVAFGLRSLW